MLEGSAPASSRSSFFRGSSLASDIKGAAAIAGRYAAALLDLADDADAVEAVANDFKSLKQMIAESEDLRVVLTSPLIERAVKGRALQALAESASFCQVTRDFVGVVSDNGRLYLLAGVVDKFLDALAARRGDLTANVTTARPLSDAQKQALSDALKQTMGREVELSTRVNPDIVGGIIVKMGSKLIDASVRTRLERLETAMKDVR